MHVHYFTFSPFMENTYLVWDDSGQAVAIDPGMSEESEWAEFQAFVEEKGLQIKLLLNTHCHIDHCFANAQVKEHYGVELFIHEKEAQMLQMAGQQAQFFGLNPYPFFRDSQPDRFIAEGDTVQWGNNHFEVLFVPGHSPGHVAFYNRQANICINGDVLMKGAMGRVDLPGGNGSDLFQSIRGKLFTQLPEDMVVYCGHGPATTIGEEKRSNPFVGDVAAG